MSGNAANTHDEDAGKGAVEQDRPGEKTNTSLAGQIGHRDQDALLKSPTATSQNPGRTKSTPASRKRGTSSTAILKSCVRMKNMRIRKSNGAHPAYGLGWLLSARAANSNPWGATLTTP
jgi:hypothetical protein